MKSLETVIGAALLLIGFCSLANAQADTRISKTWKVEKYDLTATLPVSDTDRNMSVKAILSLRNNSGATATTLTLRINQNAEIASVKINDTAADFTKSEEKIGGGGSLQRIAVRLPSLRPGEAYTATVDYKITVKENLGSSALSPAGSHFLPLSFWYPTPNSWFFARGGDFAPFRINAIAANSMTVLASGTVNGNSFDQGLNDQPFFVADNWEMISSDGISVYVPQGAGANEKARAEEIAAFTAEAKTFTEVLLGAAPNVPLRIVAVRRGAGFSGGGTIFVDDSFFHRKKIDSQTALTVAEAVAKTWLGNAVLVDNDGYGVIREGLARFIATQFLEKKYGREIADIERLRQRIAYAAVSKRDSPLKFSSPLDDYYYAAVANKGAMVWRLLERKVGKNDLFQILRDQMKDGKTDLDELRQALSSQKPLLDYEIDEVLGMNLMVGLPQVSGGVAKCALRNTGTLDAAVEVIATTAAGEKLKKDVIVPANGFSEVSFTGAGKIVQTEIDTEKLYPQTDYADDIVPREFDESDLLSKIKRAFDKQDFADAEKTAGAAVAKTPRFDDARTWLGRVMLAQGKVADADRVFREVLEEKLPTARSLAWANVGLGEIALKAGQRAQAAEFFVEAINANAEYGATLTARLGRRKTEVAGAVDDSVKAFFADFDRAAVSGRKSEVESMIISGEMPRFAGGVAGAQSWQTKVLYVDRLDADNLLVETELTLKLLSKEQESGLAVFRISKVGTGWKLSGVEMFEVR